MGSSFKFLLHERFLHRHPNLSKFISNYGPFAMLKCLLLGFGIFWIGVTIALCRKLTFEDVWVSIFYLANIAFTFESLAYVDNTWK